MRGFMEERPIIAMDFDETYTLNPVAWDSVLRTLSRSGFDVHIVTFRHPNERPEDLKCLSDQGYPLHFTGRVTKRKYMASKGLRVAVFIDDLPENC